MELRIDGRTEIPVDVTRTVVVDAPVDEVWRAFTDSDELSEWFGADVVFDPRPGGAGAFVEPGGRREAVVDDVQDGERLAFRWWPEGDPEAETTVVVEVEPVETGTRVVITETAPVAFASAARLFDFEWRCLAMTATAVLVAVAR
jgi:uncharacterized protein YndB with AHSA1/START domain